MQGYKLHAMQTSEGKCIWLYLALRAKCHGVTCTQINCS